MKILLVTLILSSIVFLAGCSGGVDKESLAKCLSENDAKMYGAYWCGACASQKQLFDKSWRHIEYVECSPPSREGQTTECEEASISTYPTWDFADGSRRTGILSFQDLADITGCEI